MYYVGDKLVKKVFKGEREVKAIYKGSVQLYPNKDNNAYSGSYSRSYTLNPWYLLVDPVGIFLPSSGGEVLVEVGSNSDWRVI